MKSGLDFGSKSACSIWGVTSRNLLSYQPDNDLNLDLPMPGTIDRFSTPSPVVCKSTPSPVYCVFSFSMSINFHNLGPNKTAWMELGRIGSGRSTPRFARLPVPRQSPHPNLNSFSLMPQDSPDIGGSALDLMWTRNREIETGRTPGNQFLNR